MRAVELAQILHYKHFRYPGLSFSVVLLLRGSKLQSSRLERGKGWGRGELHMVRKRSSVLLAGDVYNGVCGLRPALS